MAGIRKIKARRGFTLVEMMVSVFVLTVIVGVVVRAISLTTEKNSVEQAHLDVTQEAREMVDQIVRDLNQAGFPSQYMYASNPNSTSSQVAMRLVAVSETDLWFEGDVGGDGNVDSTRYTLCVAGSGGSSNCPWANASGAVFTPSGSPSISGSLPTCSCTLKRSQVLKVNGTSPTQQAPSYFTEVQNISNTTSQPLFLAFQTDGTSVTIPPDLQSSGNQAAGTNPNTLNSIKVIRINLNVLSPIADMQTQIHPGVYLTATGTVGNE